MFRVIDGPDTGKTKKLLAECAKNKGLFVCAHPERVYDKCKAYGIDLVAACTYEQYIYDFNYGDWDTYIDEVDKFLRVVGKGQIKGYSMTLEKDNVD